MPIQVEPFTLEIPAELVGLLQKLPALQHAYIVGGSVRDAALDLPVKDFDIEVFGQSYESLAEQLGRHGRVDLVGRSFGVIKWTSPFGQAFDFSSPRRDSKVSAGHKGFAVDLDPSLGIEDATARRDFTIKSLLFDPRNSTVIDCHGGLVDLRQKRLKHTSPAFVEDPLRVLRGMQFVSRFDLSVDPETIQISREIASSMPELARDRVGEEWMKWGSRSVKPSAGLRFLADTGWIQHFPQIARLRGIPQDPEWHPEGDVFTHTCHGCDAMAKLPEWKAADASVRIVWMLAILAHDFGKATTTREEMRHGRMRIISPDHESAGGPMAEAFLSSIHASNELRARVIPLVVNHLAHLQTGTDRAVRRLANRLVPETIESLCAVMTADVLGRPPRELMVPETILRLRNHATDLGLATRSPRGILLGRHLLELGWTPGKPVGEVIKAAFEAQLEGEFNDLNGAFSWLAKHPNPSWPTEAEARLRSMLETPGPK